MTNVILLPSSVDRHGVNALNTKLLELGHEVTVVPGYRFFVVTPKRPAMEWVDWLRFCVGDGK